MSLPEEGAREARFDEAILRASLRPCERPNSALHPTVGLRPPAGERRC